MMVPASPFGSHSLKTLRRSSPILNLYSLTMKDEYRLLGRMLLQLQGNQQVRTGSAPGQNSISTCLALNSSKDVSSANSMFLAMITCNKVGTGGPVDKAPAAPLIPFTTSSTFSYTRYKSSRGHFLEFLVYAHKFQKTTMVSSPQTLRYKHAIFKQTEQIAASVKAPVRQKLYIVEDRGTYLASASASTSTQRHSFRPR
jgi:hypothetical protein